MPTQETTLALKRDRCPACAWLAGFLSRASFRVGQPIRVIAAPHLVVLLAGDGPNDLDVAATETTEWSGSLGSGTTPASPTTAGAPAITTPAAVPRPRPKTQPAPEAVSPSSVYRLRR